VPLLILVVAAVINIGFDFLFVPRWQAIGAAVANVCAQLAAGIPVLAYTRRQIGRIHWEGGPLLRAAIVSALSGGVAWAGVRLLGGPAGLVIGLLSGSVVFLALGALLRILPADDARWLDESVGGRYVQRWSRQ